MGVNGGRNLFAQRVWSRIVVCSVMLALLLGVLAAPASRRVDAQTSGSTSDDAVTTEDTGGTGGGGPANKVQVINRDDNALRIKGKIQVNHINGSSVQPVNQATAYSSCTSCQSFAVALQIDFVSRNASTVAPQNAAVAVNYQCSYCTTVARALQYVIPVDDPSDTPDNVRDLIKQMQDQLQTASHTKGETAATAEMRINAVIAQFQTLAMNLYDNRDQTTDNDTPGAMPMTAPTTMPTAAGTTTTTPQAGTPVPMTTTAPSETAASGTISPTMATQPGTPASGTPAPMTTTTTPPTEVSGTVPPPLPPPPPPMAAQPGIPTSGTPGAGATSATTAPMMTVAATGTATP